MGSIFGKLLTAYALYTLNGAGLLFIFFVGSCWYVQGNFGWITLAVYLVVWWIIIYLLLTALAKWINKNSLIFGDKQVDQVPYVMKEKVRPERHGY